MSKRRRLGAWVGTCFFVVAGAGAQAPPAATATPAERAAARATVERQRAAERFAVERARLVASPVFRAAKQWTPAVADDSAARLARVAERCPACRLIRPAEAVPLADLAAGIAPAAAGGGNPVVWLPAETTPEARRELEALCPECLQVTQPSCTPGPSGGGAVVFSMVDSGGWSPGGEADPCSVPPMVMFASSALDTEIRAAITRSAGAVGVEVADYEAAAPAGCDRNLLMYRLSIAGQLLGGGQ